jgi:aspartate ammonia-lyase
LSGDYRTESDLLGEAQVEAGALYGIHTVRALENFHLTGRPVHGERSEEHTSELQSPDRA